MQPANGRRADRCDCRQVRQTILAPGCRLRLSDSVVSACATGRRAACALRRKLQTFRDSDSTLHANAGFFNPQGEQVLRPEVFLQTYRLIPGRTRNHNKTRGGRLCCSAALWRRLASRCADWQCRASDGHFALIYSCFYSCQRPVTKRQSPIFLIKPAPRRQSRFPQRRGRNYRPFSTMSSSRWPT